MEMILEPVGEVEDILLSKLGKLALQLESIHDSRKLGTKRVLRRIE
jgi:hypothetical protein